MKKLIQTLTTIAILLMAMIMSPSLFANTAAKTSNASDTSKESVAKPSKASSASNASKESNTTKASSTQVNSKNQMESKPIVVILLGAPGSGKGTQAVRLAQQLKVPHISTGDLLRENVKKETLLGKEAKGFMDSGKLVPDSLVSKMLFARIAEPDAAKGYILDGFPRTVSQANDLDNHVSNNVTLVAINLKVADEHLIDRIMKRANEKAEKRSDDTPEVAKQRLKVYHEQTKPVINHYQQKGALIEVDGEKKPREVFKSIMSAYTQKVKSKVKQ